MSAGAPDYAPILLQHVNLVVPKGTLDAAHEFYHEVMGFGVDPVPHLQQDELRWFRIAKGPQQIHVAFQREPNYPSPAPASSHHPCFQLASAEALFKLQTRIYQHQQKGGKAAAMQCDVPGEEDSGSKGIEYPTRFFCRDYAGNRLEFSAAPAKS